jgi:hypothetical protein
LIINHDNAWQAIQLNPDVLPAVIAECNEKIIILSNYCLADEVNAPPGGGAFLQTGVDYRLSAGGGAG